jgi:hypothetical protein
MIWFGGVFRFALGYYFWFIKTRCAKLEKGNLFTLITLISPFYY